MDRVMETQVFEKIIWISNLLDLYPQTASLFIDLRVNCIGCSLNRFCTISDLCEYYDLDHASVWEQIIEVID